MACQALWNTISGKSFRSDALSEIDFMYLSKESESEDAKCIFCNGKFVVWAHLDCTVEVNIEYICDFYK